ncbi:hypothetical protein [Streptomyces violaceorubidus]|uniref:hypothetical protein n=1 Tax=Streptomyces violaceorubidus TaxID=284042 RepID=UPI0012FF3153|nr:hypothetical protein [Streptomyces violaceorubidus]
MPPKSSTAGQEQALKEVRAAAKKYLAADLPPLKRAARQALREAVAQAAQAGVKQVEVARASGLSKAQVSRLSRGATSGRTPLPPAEYLVRSLPTDPIVTRYQEGATAVDLGREYGCSSTTILTILRRCQVQVRKGREIELPVSDADLVRRYVDERMQIQDIAAELGVKPNLISRRLSAAGVRIPVGHRRMDLPDAEIVRRYRAGESANRIAKSYGVSHVTVMRRVREDRARRRA